MKILGICALLLLMPVPAAAATLQTAYVPPAGGAVREAPPEAGKHRPAPMPAPAPTNHYASPPTLPTAWKM